MRAVDVIRKYKLDKKEWVHKGFHGNLHNFFPVGEQALLPMRAYFGKCYSLSVFFFSNNIGDWYWNKVDMVRLRDWYINEVDKRPSIMMRFRKDWMKQLSRLQAINSYIDQLDLSTLTAQKLADLYLKWHKRYLAEYGMAIGIQDAFSMTADEFLYPYFINALASRGIKNGLNKKLEILLSPITASFINQERRDLLKLRVYAGLKNHGQKYIAALKRHAKQYHWINNNYAKDFNLTYATFQKIISAMSLHQAQRELNELDKRQKDAATTKAKLVKQLRLDGHALKLIKLTELFAEVQDLRKKFVLIAVHYQTLFRNEIAQRVNLTPRQVEYTYIYELIDALTKDKKIKKNELERRRACVLVMNTIHGYDILSGKIARDIFKQIFSKKIKSSRELAGTVASHGFAAGTVKVIKTTHDLANMVKGDVLVASMTRPEMVSAMKIASSIVTDEGGITSHAAIISRELKIPCIIGTKIATKVLKDGDLVEVDANKGIIKILKRK